MRPSRRKKPRPAGRPEAIADEGRTIHTEDCPTGPARTG